MDTLLLLKNTTYVTFHMEIIKPEIPCKSNHHALVKFFPRKDTFASV
jgi:hypothetical protein